MEIDALIGGYIAAWSEADPAKRQTLLEDVWDENGEYTDPMSYAPGRDALHALIGGFHENNPDAYFEVSGNIAHHHHHLRFFWKMKLADGTELRGLDYGELTPDGKLRKIVGFFQT